MSFNPQFARIGEIILQKGFSTEEQIKEALIKQDNFALKLGETLLKLGYLKEKQLLVCLSLQLDIPIVESAELMELDVDVVSLISEPFARENRVLCIRATEDSCIVAMTNPDDLNILDSLKKVLNKNVEPVLIGDSLLTDALEKYYKRDRKSVV